MDFSKVVFKRRFALNMYKDHKLMLGKMSFSKDFVNDLRGDPYPIISSNKPDEAVADNVWRLRSGSVTRWLSPFFPYATYTLSVNHLFGSAGFEFRLPDLRAVIAVCDHRLVFDCELRHESISLPDSITAPFTFMVSCRPGAFDVYFLLNGNASFFHTFLSDSFADSACQSVFSSGCCAVSVSGEAEISAAFSCMDCGISQADLRPIRYENGDVMLEGGKLFLTASIRMQENMFQGVFSWIPGTAEFELTGTLFFDAGDGRWCGDVASSILYNRSAKQYYLWVCSFNNGHILGHAAFDGDPRFGVNVIDIELMEKASPNSELTDFVGFEGDEDPDFFFDDEQNRWFMAICRLDPSQNAYRYLFFESERPFDGYRFIGCGNDGAETGGSFVKIDGERIFVCGNSFEKVSDYRIYTKVGMKNAEFDLPDGGFRGWGTLIPVKLGTRTRYFWITFDRHNGSEFNWSYGNIYCFEADIR